MRSNQLTMESQLVIRIWTSQFHSSHKGEDVGHISIEIPNRKMKHPYHQTDPDLQQEIPMYISLWPKWVLPDDMQENDVISSRRIGLFRPEPHQLVLDAKDDIRIEERKPEIIYTFYSFNIDTMSEKFRAMQAEIKGWVFFGNNFFVPESHSCATLAATILKSGDIHDFFSSGSVTSIISPDQLSIALQRAKRKELEKFPETKQFRIEDEIEIETEKVRKCLVM